MHTAYPNSTPTSRQGAGAPPDPHDHRGQRGAHSLLIPTKYSLLNVIRAIRDECCLQTVRVHAHSREALVWHWDLHCMLCIA